MTIIAGFRCEDGVVLAADTEISFTGGIGKTYESKLFLVDAALGCHLAYTGAPEFAKELVDDLRRVVDGKTSQEALAAIKTTYRNFMEEHYTNAPEDEKTSAWILVTIREGEKVRLYQAKDRHFTEVAEYAVLGIGQEQGEAAFQPLYNSWITANQAGYAMIYAIRLVKRFVQGCGGDTEIREVEDRESSFISPYLPQSQATKEAEEDFDFFDGEMHSLMIAFSDMQVSKEDFKHLLKSFEKALMKHRAERLRVYEKKVKAVAEALSEHDETTQENL